MYRQNALIKIFGFFFKLCNFFFLDVSRLTLCQSTLCMDKPKKELISTEDQKARKLLSAQRNSP